MSWFKRDHVQPKDERWLPEPLARAQGFDVKAALKEEGPLPPKGFGGCVQDISGLPISPYTQQPYDPSWARKVYH